MSVSSDPGAGVVRRISRFGRVLRQGGLEVGPGRVLNAVRSLEAIELGQRDQLYWALRCTMVARREQIPVFDAAFEAFWGKGARGPLPAQQRPRPTSERETDEAAAGAMHRRVRLGDEPDEDAEQADGRRSTAWSAHEQLADLDFAQYGDDELRQARAMVDRIARSIPLRRSLRHVAAPSGRLLDDRRTLRAAMRTEGHPIERRFRAPKVVPRRLVFLLDVSGSMEAYARASVMFLQAAVQASPQVEAMTFGTRLTRLTPHLAGRDPRRALEQAARAVPDWAGGTRIGENLQAFNDLWGRRGMTRGAVVVIVSDGWERGNVELLRRQMERLARAAHRVVWVNPLAGDPEYRPLAAGMAAAMPSIDAFLPGHNLRSLRGLADVLAAVGGSGPRGSGGVGSG